MPLADAPAPPLLAADQELALFRQLEHDPSAAGIALRLLHSLAARDQLEQALALAQKHLARPECRDWLREHHIGERNEPAARALLIAEGDESLPRTWVDRALLLHFSGRFGDAGRLLEQALQRDARHAPAHNHLGRALHNLGQTDAALHAFERAAKLDPLAPQHWNNLGHALRARGQLQRACDCFEQGVALSPGLRSPRINLGITRYALEQPEAALTAFSDRLRRDPRDVEALSNAGLAQHLLGQLEASRALYQRALALAPEHASTWYYLGTLLNELGEESAAREALQRALQLQPQDPDAWAELAALEEQSGRLDAAQQACQRGLALQPGHPQLVLEQAKLDRRGGRHPQALQRLRGLDPRRLPARTAQQYHYELGTQLDRAGEVDGAWQEFSLGNALAARSRRRAHVDDAAFFQRIDALRRWVDSTPPTPFEDADDDGADLCFLLSFPRSGTTLLDTWLDAHPQIDSIEEKPTWEWARERCAALQQHYPFALDQLSAAQRSTLRQDYRRAVAQHLPQRRGQRVLDKLPMRSIEAGLLYKLFPRARFLFAERHPCDVVLSNFMQQYAVNEAFVHFYTLPDCTRMYDTVLSLWRRQLEVFPLNPIRVRYERLVDNAEAELSRVCAELDLAFEPAMLDRARAARGPVRTNSYQQVAEPVYTRAVARWQRYRHHLAPSLATLQPHAEWLGYALDPQP